MSNDFINECKNRANGNRLGKITTENVDINNSNNLQKFSINSGCYSNGTIIGTVYVKCLKADFINAIDNNLLDKTIQAQIGVKYADTSTEYINMGNYSLEHQNTEQTAKMSQITAYDKLYEKLDDIYVCNIDYSSPKTLTDLYVDVCNNLGLTPNTTNILNGNIPIVGNPFKNGEKNRTVLKAVSTVACSFVVIDNDTNNIELAWLSDNEEPDYVFEKSDYSNVTGGDNVLGPTNTVVIRNSQVESENFTMVDPLGLSENGEKLIVISEDYILYNSQLRQMAMPAIFNRLKGLTYTNCKLITYYGKPFLPIGAKIQVKLDNNGVINTYNLIHDFTYDGTFTSVIESPVLTNQEQKTKQQSDLGKKLSDVQIEVNKQKEELKLYASKQVDLSDEVTSYGEARLGNCMDINLYKLSIRGDLTREHYIVNEDNTTYPVYLDTYLVVEHDEIKDRYKLPIDYLTHLNDVYDEFLIENNKTKLIKRIGIEKGNKYILPIPQETELENINIKLYKGDNVIYLEDYGNLIISAKYLIQNPYSDKFADKVDLQNEINIRTEEVQILSKEQSDMGELLKGEIITRAGEVQMLVEKKLDGDQFTSANIFAKINGDKSEAGINADKILLSAMDVLNLLSGNEINLTSKNITIASEKFSVDKSGHVYMASATLTDGLLKIGDKEIFNQTGVLSMFQYQCSGGEQDLGWYEDYDYATQRQIFKKHGLQILYNIPENFTVLNAHVVMTHIPCQSEYMEDTTKVSYSGYARNVGLYYENSMNSLKYSRYGFMGLPDYSSLPKTEIYGAFGTNRFTGNQNTASTVTTSNIASNLIKGSTQMLLIDTNDSTVSSRADALQKTAMATATLFVIGYYKI